MRVLISGSLALLVGLVLSGCAERAQPSAETASPSQTSSSFEDWMDKADTEANAAIANEKFALWAFGNRTVSLAGIDPRNNDVEKIQATCGVQMLPGYGDSLRPGEDTSRRNQLRDYAIRYNEKVLAACRRHFDF